MTLGTATNQNYIFRNRIEDADWTEVERTDDDVQVEVQLGGPFGWVVFTLPPDDREQFDHFAQQWRNETAHLSSPASIAMNHAYQRIIGMGERAIPYILEELTARPGHWFWALNAITGAEPVPAESRGRVAEMAEAWIEWGRSQGYRV